MNNKADRDVNNITNAGQNIIAHNSAISNTSIDISLQSSGSSYTAPADGYFYIRLQGNSTDEKDYIIMNNTSNNFLVLARKGISSPTAEIISYIPVSKNNIVSISYSIGTLSTSNLKFFYLNGSQQ